MSFLNHLLPLQHLDAEHTVCSLLRPIPYLRGVSGINGKMQRERKGREKQEGEEREEEEGEGIRGREGCRELGGGQAGYLPIYGRR